MLLGACSYARPQSPAGKFSQRLVAAECLETRPAVMMAMCCLARIGKATATANAKERTWSQLCPAELHGAHLWVTELPVWMCWCNIRVCIFANVLIQLSMQRNSNRLEDTDEDGDRSSSTSTMTDVPKKQPPIARARYIVHIRTSSISFHRLTVSFKKF